jgi:hypothetical protein
MSLNVGSNSFDVVVTAEDNTAKTYTITVTREAATLSSNANLSIRSVTGYAISPAFNADTTAYTLTVPNAVSSITSNATKADNAAKSVSGTGTKNLSVGSNPFDVVVTAEDNTTKTYTIIVTRQEAEAVLSNDAMLDNIVVGDGALSPAFSATTLNYTVNVAGNVNSITLEVVKRNASQTVVGNGQKTLQVGSNPFTITVTAEDGVSSTVYTVTVVRATNNNGNPENPATAVETQTARKLYVYPNPIVNGQLIMDNGQLKAGEAINVYSVNGALVLTGNVSGGSNTTLNLSHLSQGTYVVKVGGKVAKVVVR